MKWTDARERRIERRLERVNRKLRRELAEQGHTQFNDDKRGGCALLAINVAIAGLMASAAWLIWMLTPVLAGR